jgi:putative copper export protein/methionine-rich copper-binding protein CopC
MKGGVGLKRLGYCLILCFVLVLSLPALVSAHAYLEKSVPLQDSEENNSPSEIRIKFTEHIDINLSQMTIEDEKGNLIIGKLSSEDTIWLIYQIPPLEDGVYKVKWQILSVDSHVTEGSFRFGVGVKLIKTKPSDTLSLDDTAVKSEPLPSVLKHTPEPTKPKVAPTPSALPEIEVTVTQDTIPNKFTDPTTTSKPLQSAASSPPIVQHDPEASIKLNSNQMVKKNSSVPAETIVQEEQPLQINDDSNVWDSIAFKLLRILEVFVAIVMAGFIFFRYFVLGTDASDAIQLFSLQNERMITLIAITVFASTGIMHIWLLASQLSQMGLYTEWDRIKTILASPLGKIAWVNPSAAAILFALTFIPKHDLRWAAWLKAVCALCIIVTFPLTGHANASSTYTSLSIISHTLHMLAGAVWFVGLVGLLIATFQVNKRSIILLELHAMIHRFSMVAFPLIVLTVASGILLTVIRIGRWSDLVQSDYGRLILIKSAITLLIFIIAAFHRLVFIPKLQQATRTELSAEPKTIRTFVFFLRWEIGMAVVIFIVAGMLSTSSPP